MTPRLGASLPVLLLAAALAGCSPGPSRSPAPSALPSPTPADAAATASPTLAPSPSATASPTPAPTPPTGIVPGRVDRTSLDLAATYDVRLDVATATGGIEVDASIEIRNTSGAPIDRLELNTIAARLGGLDGLTITIDGMPATATVDDQTLVVPLGGMLPANASTTVLVRYAATLRDGLGGSDWLFSRAGGELALYRWIPWVSRAVPFDRPNHGDPFVTPVSAEVQLRVTLDHPLVVASAQPRGTDAAGTVTDLPFRDVRDVALVIGDFSLATRMVGDVEVRAYTRAGGLSASRLLDQAEHALTSMAERLGTPYPYPVFAMAETAGGYGMESPGLIWIPRDTAPANLAYLVHHETAHQWFYGLVGNDQQAEPFADEAAADLLARTVLGLRRASRCDPAPLDRSIVRYSQACYYEVVYIQGGNVLDEIRRSMGTDRFWAAIHDYLGAERFAISGTTTLLEALRAASPVDLLPILRARFPDLY